MQDPIGAFERIRDLFLSYLDTAFRIRNPTVAAERRHLLCTPGNLCSEPLIEPMLKYKSEGFRLEDLASSKDEDMRLPGFTADERLTFAELALAGMIDSKPAAEGVCARNADYDLYSHQAEMLSRGVRQGLPGIVTSGTGSGKTEAFLLPVFAMLSREARKWPSPSANYLSRRWWQDPSGRPVLRYSQLPDRPSIRVPNISPFRLQGKASTPIDRKPCAHSSSIR